MQLFKIFLPLLLLTACNRSAAPTKCPPCPEIVRVPEAFPVRDTVFVPDTQYQALLEVAVRERDSFAKISGNSAILLRRNDSLHSRLLVADYKLERVGYYLRIVNRNPSQVKFLRGWLNRALAE